MIEDLRSRLGEARQDWDWVVNQTEEMARIIQEQQVRLEEMDLLVRQRDEQLAQQQTRVEELEETLRQRNQEVEALRARLAEREEALSLSEQDLTSLRAQLAQREAAEVTLREELSQARVTTRVAVPEEAKVPAEALLDRLAALEELVQRQSEALAALRPLIQQEMIRLHSRLDRLEVSMATAPTRVAAPPVAEAARPAEPAAAVARPVAVVPEAAPPPLKLAEAETPLQAVLHEALESVPGATLVGLAGRDGLTVEVVPRQAWDSERALEVELAELTGDATRVASALGTGLLLTLSFQAGSEHYLVSPVGENHFAFLLLPDEAIPEFRRAQAVLLQTSSRLNESF